MSLVLMQPVRGWKVDLGSEDVCEMVSEAGAVSCRYGSCMSIDCHHTEQTVFSYPWSTCSDKRSSRQMDLRQTMMVVQNVSWSGTACQSHCPAQRVHYMS